MKESDIQKSIKEFLEYSGWLVVKYNSVGIYKKATNSYITVGRKGVADLLCFKKGKPPLAVEVKAEKGKVSDFQLDWGLDFIRHGGMYLIAKNIDDVVQALKKLDKSG